MGRYAEVYVRKLGRGERNRLKRMAKHGRDGRAVNRARMVLFSGQRKKLSEIAGLLDTTPEVVSCWIRRYEAEGVDGLYDRERSGRPAKANEAYEARLVKLVAVHPGEVDYDCPWGVWTVGRLAARMEHEGFRAVSDDTVRRALHRHKYAFLRPKLDLKHKQDPKKVRAFLRRLREVKGGWMLIPA
jgi:transposase